MRISTLPGELSRLSGVRVGNLKQDPAFQALPEHLARIREQLPQRDGENKQTYARRLHGAHQHLTWSELSRLSGVREGHLKEDPAFQALPPRLAPIREQLPQRDGENKQTYARRLHSAHQHLTWSELSLVSGVTERSLKKDPAFRALLDHLEPIREQLPQRDGESNPAYARRLHRVHSYLSWSELSLLSGVTEHHLKEDPAFRAPLADLAPIREEVPQLEGESKFAYARRLHSAHPHLTWRELSQLSGVLEWNLKADPAFRVLPDHLARIREEVPQRDGESNPAYAGRLHSAHRQLTLRELSQLSGVTQGNLKRYPAFKQAPTLSTGVGSANSALPGSGSSRFRGLKRTAIEAAAYGRCPKRHWPYAACGRG
ncbi:MAG: hypothetical protein JF606_21495 [Burkholderiales bacterium]|nr:hypothetical protein [Burkholderiales bacterium]